MAAKRHKAEEIVTKLRQEAALAGLAFSTIQNPAYTDGMGRSLATGMGAPGIQDTDGVFLMLADMQRHCCPR